MHAATAPAAAILGAVEQRLQHEIDRALLLVQVCTRAHTLQPWVNAIAVCATLQRHVSRCTL
jgi:hypothetical protein